LLKIFYFSGKRQTQLEAANRTGTYSNISEFKEVGKLAEPSCGRNEKLVDESHVAREEVGLMLPDSTSAIGDQPFKEEKVSYLFKILRNITVSYLRYLKKDGIVNPEPRLGTQGAA
jgi:hypothetical protein